MIQIDDTWMPRTSTFSEGYVRHHYLGDEDFFYPTDHKGKRDNRTVHMYRKHDRRIVPLSGMPLEGIVIITDYEK